MPALQAKVHTVWICIYYLVLSLRPHKVEQALYHYADTSVITCLALLLGTSSIWEIESHNIPSVYCDLRWTLTMQTQQSAYKTNNKDNSGTDNIVYTTRSDATDVCVTRVQSDSLSHESSTMALCKRITHKTFPTTTATTELHDIPLIVLCSVLCEVK